MSTLPLNDRLSPTYVAGAAQTDFAGDFPLIYQGDGSIGGLFVRRVRAEVETILAYPADFGVPASTDDGFTARLVVPALAGDLIQVYSTLPAARDRAFQPGGAIKTAILEGDADSFQAQLQELRRDVGRAVLGALGQTSRAALIARAGFPLQEGGTYGVQTDLGIWSAILPALATVTPGACIRCADVGYHAGVNHFTVTVDGGAAIDDHGAGGLAFVLNTSNTGVEFWAAPTAWVAIPYGS